jgi:hypothetical protein
MNINMYQLNVYTGDGNIYIKQDDGIDGPQIIVISPAQIELVIGLLRQAAAEATEE